MLLARNPTFGRSSLSHHDTFTFAYSNATLKYYFRVMLILQNYTISSKTIKYECRNINNPYLLQYNIGLI